MSTKAVADGEHFLITGSKCFITRAAIAAFYVTFARIGSEPGSKAIAAFIVEKGDPGVRIGHLDEHMGLRGGASAEVIYEQCRVHKSRMIVAPGSFGRIMKGLNQARELPTTAELTALGEPWTGNSAGCPRLWLLSNSRPSISVPL